MAWMCRTIVRMAGQLPVESIDQDRMQRLEKVEANVARISEQLEGVSAGLITLKGKKEQLRTTESQLEEALRKDKALKEECDRLEAVIKEYREMKAPDLRTRKERLAQEKATLLSEYDALLNQCDQQEQDNTAYRDKICEQKARCETLKNTFAQMKENLEKLEEEYEQQQEQLSGTERPAAAYRYQQAQSGRADRKSGTELEPYRYGRVCANCLGNG